MSRAVLIEMLSQVFEKHSGLANVSFAKDCQRWRDCFQYNRVTDKFYLWYTVNATGNMSVHEYQAPRNARC